MQERQAVSRIAVGLLLLVVPLALAGCNLLADSIAGGGPSDCGNGICEAAETVAGCPTDCAEDGSGRACTPGGDQCDDDEICINNRCTTDNDNGNNNGNDNDNIVCGDDECDLGETISNCPQDCAQGPVGAECGNDACESGETIFNCPADCVDAGFPVCGNDACEAGETVLSCPLDCADDGGPGIPFCGNNVCESGETALSCPGDCNDGGAGCTPTCITAEQCEDGDPCTVNRCVSAGGQCGPVSVCRSNPLNCPFGQTCVGGICRQQQAQCFSDADCGTGQDCVAGRCIAP